MPASNEAPGRAGGIKNGSRSRRLDGVANAAPTDTGHRLGGRSAPEPQLVQAPVLSFLLLNVRADHTLVATDGGHEVPARPEVLPHKVPLALPVHARQMDRALPLINPTTCATAYFGGMAISMWT